MKKPFAQTDVSDVPGTDPLGRLNRLKDAFPRHPSHLANEPLRTHLHF